MKVDHLLNLSLPVCSSLRLRQDPLIRIPGDKPWCHGTSYSLLVIKEFIYSLNCVLVCRDECTCFMNCAGNIICPFSGLCSNCTCSNGTLMRANRCVVPMPSPCVPGCNYKGQTFQVIVEGKYKWFRFYEGFLSLESSALICLFWCDSYMLFLTCWIVIVYKMKFVIATKRLQLPLGILFRCHSWNNIVNTSFSFVYSAAA